VVEVKLVEVVEVVLGSVLVVWVLVVWGEGEGWLVWVVWVVGLSVQRVVGGVHDGGSGQWWRW
jgi:hypothetical protein